MGRKMGPWAVRSAHFSAPVRVSAPERFFCLSLKRGQKRKNHRIYCLSKPRTTRCCGREYAIFCKIMNIVDIKL